MSSLLVNPSAIEKLRKSVGPGCPTLLQDLYDLFCQDSPETLSKMRDDLERGDLRGLGRKAHSLKSSCAILGAITMSEASSRIEMLIQQEPPIERAVLEPELRELLVQLQSMFAPVAEALRKLVSP